MVAAIMRVDVFVRRFQITDRNLLPLMPVIFSERRKRRKRTKVRRKWVVDNDEVPCLTMAAVTATTG